MRMHPDDGGNGTTDAVNKSSKQENAGPSKQQMVQPQLRQQEHQGQHKGCDGTGAEGAVQGHELLEAGVSTSQAGGSRAMSNLPTPAATRSLASAARQDQAAGNAGERHTCIKPAWLSRLAPQ